MSNHCPPLLRELLLRPSPTGSEQAVQRFLSDGFHGIVDLIDTDVAGNLVLAINPNAKRKMLLAAHCDQVGFLVRHISPEGYLYVELLGGADRVVITGGHVVVHNQRGAVKGVFGRKRGHFETMSQPVEVPSMDQTWVDIGATSREEAEEAVEVGDYATFELGITDLGKSLISSPGLDNKAGLYVCLEVLRRCARRPGPFGLYVASSVQEEIGSRGAVVVAQRLHPEIGIAVDTVPATDDPGSDLARLTHVTYALGKGPSISVGPNTNPAVGRLLGNAARKKSLPFQIEPSGKAAPNDSKVLQTADGGVAAAALSIPLRNMHTQVEVIDPADLETAISLLCEFIDSLTEDTDLRPISFGKE